jgi:hypothetical protein
MAITNGYATRNQIKAALRIGTADTQDDELIDNCAGAASRLIDGYAKPTVLAVRLGNDTSVHRW